MATITNSWLWYSDSPLTGFDASSQENLDSTENGTSIDPASYTEVTWNDYNDDGLLGDSDTDDSYGSDNDTVTIDGVDKIIKEMALFKNSSMTIDGVTYTVDLPVWVFEDGTYAARLNDADIPDGVSWTEVTDIELGSFQNGNASDGDTHRGEYTHSWVTTRDEFFVCFTAGTMIETQTGPRPIETLCPGDLVKTLDHGLQPVRWIGHRSVIGKGAMAPVKFERNTIGNQRPLRVSPQHRMLVTGWRAQLMFGTDQVLVSAKHLVNGDTIYAEPARNVTYVHVLFDQHEILFAEGSLSESFHPGAQGLSVLDQAARDELISIFPELSEQNVGRYGKTARLCLNRHEAMAMAH